MAKITNFLSGLFGQDRKPVAPYSEQGTSGTPISHGYVFSRERNHKLRGRNRYETAMDIILNASVVGAGQRFYLNLVAKPKWQFKPARDVVGGGSSDEAKRIAAMVEENLNSLTDSWPRIVRRMAAFKYYGFGVHEWTAQKTDDGPKLLSIESRPWHTIEQWDVSQIGTILGMVQRPPFGGETFYLPRGKVAYLVDDALTDSPEGLGLWRHLAEPFERLKAYAQIEWGGFERDLRGIPVGFAPYKALAEAVKNSEMTQEQADAITKPLEQLVSMSARSQNTGAVLDSSHHTSINKDGDENISSAKMMDIKLLTASGNGFSDIGNAIERIQYQMAMLCGTESLLVGSGSTGSRALSEDKSRNLYLNVDAGLLDVVSAVNKDIIPPLMILRGIPRHLWPRAEAESAAYMDVVKRSQLLVNLAQAGAVTNLQDPAVNELRLAAGLAAVTNDMMTMDSLDAMNDTDVEE